MGRAKISMEFITREKSRNATFAKRKKGLKKKIYEFSTLCGVDALMIVYGSNQINTDRPIEPEVWPENHDQIHRIVDRFHSSGKHERAKRNSNLFDLIEDRRKKMEEELAKLRRKNSADADLMRWDDRINLYSEDQLRELLGSLESKIEIIAGRVRLMRGQDCIIEGGSGMIEYSHRTPDQNSFTMWRDPVLAQPITYMKPVIDHQQITTVEYQSDPSVYFDMGPVAPPLMSTTNGFHCDNLGCGPTWNFNTWPVVNRSGFHDSEVKVLQEIEFANAGASSFMLSSNMQPISPWPYLSYTAPGTTQQMGLGLHPYTHDFQDPIQEFNF